MKAFIKLDAWFPFFMVETVDDDRYPKEVELPPGMFDHIHRVMNDVYDIQEKLKDLYDSN